MDSVPRVLSTALASVWRNTAVSARNPGVVALATLSAATSNAVVLPTAPDAADQMPVLMSWPLQQLSDQSLHDYGSRSLRAARQRVDAARVKTRKYPGFWARLSGRLRVALFSQDLRKDAPFAGRISDRGPQRMQDHAQASVRAAQDYGALARAERS